jgi:hypothetical protein
MSEELEKREGGLLERQQISLSPVQTEEIINDFEAALNLIQQYQRVLGMLDSPDPNTVPARRLLNKYNMVATETSKRYRIFLDGRDITDFPDSLPATAVEEDQPEWESGNDD